MSETHLGNVLLIQGTAAGDDELLFTSSDLSGYDAFMIMSSGGAVDVEATIDGTNWSTAPLSLQDFGATTTDPVLVTAAGRVYGFAGKFRGLRVRQNGVTGATASLLAWNM